MLLHWAGRPFPTSDVAGGCWLVAVAVAELQESQQRQQTAVPVYYILVMIQPRISGVTPLSLYYCCTDTATTNDRYRRTVCFTFEVLYSSSTAAVYVVVDVPV